MAMSTHSRTIHLSLGDSEYGKRLKDPFADNLHHFEAILPFSEVVKLDRGNANVRPPNRSKPAYRDMLETVEKDPDVFHVRNRGITYLCDRFQHDNRTGVLTVTVPVLDETNADDDERKFGIGDGGHTFGVISDTIQRSAELQAENPDWVEPHVRVHFIAGYDNADIAIEQVVEALNTSAQVKQVSLDEYGNKFDDLKEALIASGFDVAHVAFRENENKEWSVEEIVQRMACFLRERWTETHPASMYKSKSKALDLYTNDSTRPEFEKLYGVVKDVITLPEYIQSALSDGKIVPRKSVSKLRVCKGLKTSETRAGTTFATDYRLDQAALLPMAAAFRELLRLKGNRYEWRYRPEVVFPKCAESLYAVLTSRLQKTRTGSQLGSDMEYWGNCAMIVMREMHRLIEAEHA
jgi:hypothetical protein